MTQHFDRYTCEEMLRRLDDYLDRELTPDEMRRAEEHLETCEACVREFGFEANVIRAVRAKLRQVDVPETLLDRVAMSLARERAGENGNGSS
ncbi:MAG: zf-HC2 domain-containing protein [Gemmatimonadota bacterium]|nr:zf-HC2 domain-containing protein [Gemmatimonadota bacterium]